MNESSCKRVLEPSLYRVGMALCSLLLFLGLASAVPSRSLAEPHSLMMMSAAFKDGTITGVHQTTFDIDGRTFTFAPDAVIVDDRGREAGPDILVVRLEVKYRVKKEHNDMIDRMIVFLPR